MALKKWLRICADNQIFITEQKTVLYIEFYKNMMVSKNVQEYNLLTLVKFYAQRLGRGGCLWFIHTWVTNLERQLINNVIKSNII